MTQKHIGIDATDMLGVLGDEHSRKILIATHIKPRTAMEIADAQGIPIAACYRRIKILEDMAFIQKDEQILTQNGKRRWTYISNIHRMELFYTDGKMAARCELRNGFIEQN
jgi:predicted transcriptional regulator